ncbi:unnamed protein product [Caenorhabditis auriculariae]|uniref:Protein XRP2 n=1 Tax=Caenorhabditis auriculariae TaxID=2777116 RepID=A0A8S1HWX9_9PELO|nr:unnamed protein product [Caenorhabditis auriculariae]
MSRLVRGPTRQPLGPPATSQARPDQYKVAENDIPTAEVPQYSWDTKSAVDVSKFTIADIHTGVKCIRSDEKDSMQVENCTNSVVLLLKPTASLTVDDCRDCLVVLGPCAGSVFIRDCANCTVLTACQQLRTRDCHGLRVGIVCATQPIIENSNDVFFYPLTLNYPSLKEHMKSASLSLFMGNVNSVHDFTPETKPNFRVVKTPLQLDGDQEESLRFEGVLTQKEDSIIPVFSTSKEVSNFVYSFQEKNESRVDFEERCAGFSDALRSDPDVSLLSCNDIDTSKLADNLVPVQGMSSRLVLFEVVAAEERLYTLCKGSPFLFHVSFPEKVAQFRNLISIHSTHT